MCHFLLFFFSFSLSAFCWWIILQKSHGTLMCYKSVGLFVIRQHTSSVLLLLLVFFFVSMFILFSIIFFYTVCLALNIISGKLNIWRYSFKWITSRITCAQLHAFKSECCVCCLQMWKIVSCQSICFLLRFFYTSSRSFLSFHFISFMRHCQFIIFHWMEGWVWMSKLSRYHHF